MWIRCLPNYHHSFLTYFHIKETQFYIIYYSNYSNFDKHHCIDFHRVHCTEPTPLSLNNFFCLSLILSKFAVVIANVIAYNLTCKSSTRQTHVCPWVGNCKKLRYRNSTQKFKFIAPLLLTISNMQCVCGTHFQPFNVRLKPVCN